MSSGFVSGGTAYEAEKQDDEWLKVKQELDLERTRKAQEGKQEGGKSLYEILQQNKAAKQEEFEESIRLKNQFRTLDEDEVEFLDSLLESTRAKEEALKKETLEQLETFHRQREEVDKAYLESTDTNDSGQPGLSSLGEEEQWTVSARKRRRTKANDGLPGLKRKKPLPTDVKANADDKSGAEVNPAPTLPKPQPVQAQSEGAALSKDHQPSRLTNQPEQKPPTLSYSTPTPLHVAPVSTLGLAAYSSDDDDDHNE